MKPLVVVLIYFITLIMLSEGHKDRTEGTPGGYHLVRDLESEHVVKAATFCVHELQKPQNSGKYSSYLISSNHLRLHLIDAYQQVVAGMNYRLTIKLDDDKGNCRGAFTATVYDHFGELSVTDWGREISCRQAARLQAQALAARERDGGRDGE